MKTNIHIILILTLMRDFSMEEKRTFLVEIKAYDIEISYYKFNVISAFQKYRVLCYAPIFYLLFPRAYVFFHVRFVFIASFSKTGKRRKDRE